VVISRFCEPFTDGASTDASITVAEKCIENKCQFIFKTGVDLPDKAKQLLIDNLTMSKCHLRFISNTGQIGDLTGRELSKHMNLASDQLYQGNNLINSGVNVSAFFDPFIIGVNNVHCKNLIKQLSDYGFKSIVMKQLFATDYFLRYLKLRIDRRYIQLLNVNTAGYWTYNNNDYLEYLLPIMEECEKHNITMSICCNRAVNELVYGNSNCCQLDNPIGFYNKEGKIINE
jgi:hypothetical protein